MRRILVCGSRTFDEQDVVYEVLNQELAHGQFELIHGAAPGADTLAHGWALAHRVLSTAYPANWTLYGRRAGYVRNQQMLDLGKPDKVLAFIDKELSESRGTAMMTKLATTAGVPTTVYRWPSLSGELGGHCTLTVEQVALPLFPGGDPDQDVTAFPSGDTGSGPEGPTEF